MFEKMLYARWGDMDFNGHMKNTAYLDDDLEYLRELHLLDPVRVTFFALEIREDGRFVFVNEFFREDGTKCARVTSSGAWFDLDRRKVTSAPEELRRLCEQLLQPRDDVS